MPSKSKSQQRFFGMVDAYKKGELKDASSKIKKAAKGMSMDDVKDFAETKHKGLPEKVEENIIRLTEGDLHRIVKESVQKILSEGGYDKYGIYHTDSELSAMENAFGPTTKLGSEFLERGVKVLKGKIDPNARYTEGYYILPGTTLGQDVIIELPNGAKHTLFKK